MSSTISNTFRVCPAKAQTWHERGWPAVKKIKVGIFGGTGKMGHEIRSLIEKSSEFQIIFSVGKNYSKLPSVDIIIDFSVGGTEKALNFAEKTLTPIVSGATGLTEKEIELFHSTAKKVPVFWSSNLSMGVAALKKAIESLAIVKDFNISIDEWHHKYKKDSPSGTAKTLAETIKKVTEKKEIEITAKRAGGIFGVHMITAIGDHEYIQLSHHALDRAVFAEGALRAASWLIKKPKGFYGMDDLVGSSNSLTRKKSVKK